MQTIFNLAILLIINYYLTLINRAIADINRNLYTMNKKMDDSSKGDIDEINS